MTDAQNASQIVAKRPQRLSYTVRAPVVLQEAVIVWKLEEWFESQVEIKLFVGGSSLW